MAVLGATGSQGVRNSTEGSWLGAWKPGSEGCVRAQWRPLTSSALEGAEEGRERRAHASPSGSFCPGPLRDWHFLGSQSIWAGAHGALGARIF